MKTKKPLIIILLGRSGCGKGTQAKLLQEKFNLKYVGSGDILRKRCKINDFTGKKLRQVLKNGGFAPTAIMFKLWIDSWEEFKTNSKFLGFIVDGSPRKILEAHLMEQALKWYDWHKFVKIFLINISRREGFNRLTKRRICKKCSNPIPWLGEFKKLKVCNKCGGELTRRADDVTKAINRRLDLFEKEVVPVLSHYKKQGKLIIINGEQSIKDVFADISRSL